MPPDWHRDGRRYARYFYRQSILNRLQEYRQRSRRMDYLATIFQSQKLAEIQESFFNYGVFYVPVLIEIISNFYRLYSFQLDIILWLIHVPNFEE